MNIPQPSLPDVPAPSPTQLAKMQPFTPPNRNDQKALYAITFKATPAPVTPTGGGGDTPFTMATTPSRMSAGYNSHTGTNMLIFDAFRRAQHRQVSRITQHPLQTGISITDHAVLQPAHITLEVQMSDAITSFSMGADSNPMWDRNPSKSVSAYQVMEQMMQQRILFTLLTRLETYDNMLLEEINVEDGPQTYFGGLVMILNCQQVFLVDVAQQTDSQRIQTTGETTQGTQQGQTPDQTTVDQHQVTQEQQSTAKNVPGAGIFSSAINWIQSIWPSY